MLKSKTGNRLGEIRADKKREWMDLQNKFKTNWDTIKRNKRIEIHINSFSIAIF